MNEEFFRLVSDMREVQKRYWNKKSYLDFDAMKQLENKVDEKLKVIGAELRKDEQPGLFA